MGVDIVVALLVMFIAFVVVAYPGSFGRAGAISVGRFGLTMSAGAKKPLPQAGEVCSSCEPFWTSQKMGPKYLVHVFDPEGNPLKTDSGIEIIVCPHCDGDLILRLDKHCDAS
jgi:hypothetical protein